MSYRLQQLTSLQVNPNGAVVDIDVVARVVRQDSQESCLQRQA